MAITRTTSNAIFSASGHQQFQGRQLPSGHVQHGIGQNQLNPGNQMNRHLGQFSGAANSALFNAAQTTPSQMIPNISATMPSQSLLPRMQFELSGNNPQRSHASQMLSDQSTTYARSWSNINLIYEYCNQVLLVPVFNMGAANTSGMMPIQQQQQQQQQQQHSSTVRKLNQ
ncbi:hypothetical protein Prudu_000351 [Prunus dulcis]|uniref:Uncharacterized protein n=1 Tax=Prunus dulcis TaxID=3755 RepID=A0A4Y1QLC9_PRUDU|nr:hypothetical protein Prudu_000351 [Prunus dulcis]